MQMLMLEEKKKSLVMKTLTAKKCKDKKSYAYYFRFPLLCFSSAITTKIYISQLSFFISWKRPSNVTFLYMFLLHGKIIDFH